MVDDGGVRRNDQEVLVGTRYRVTTRHVFEGECLRAEQDDETGDWWVVFATDSSAGNPTPASGTRRVRLADVEVRPV